MSKHAIVWIDHQQARLFSLVGEAVVAGVVKARPHHGPDHRHTDGIRVEADATFLREVVDAIEPTSEVLVVGPSTAKLELIRYAHRHAHDFEKRVVGVETVDHPTDGQLVAFARHYFRAADRMK